MDTERYSGYFLLISDEMKFLNATKKKGKIMLL